MVLIRPEIPARDADPVEALFDATFGPGHFAKTAERLREFSASLADLNRVAELDGEIVAVCRVWPIRVGAAPALFYGPVAVAHAHRGACLGLEVTRAALEAGREARWPAALLIGAPSYFGRIGFEVLAAGQVEMPGPQDGARIMGYGLAAGLEALQGRVRAAPDLADASACSARPVLAPALPEAS